MLPAENNFLCKKWIWENESIDKLRTPLPKHIIYTLLCGTNNDSFFAAVNNISRKLKLMMNRFVLHRTQENYFYINEYNMKTCLCLCYSLSNSGPLYVCYLILHIGEFRCIISYFKILLYLFDPGVTWALALWRFTILKYVCCLLKLFFSKGEGAPKEHNTNKLTTLTMHHSVIVLLSGFSLSL